MDRVYSSAHLNLSATASANGSEGLFRQREPRLLHRIEYEVSAVSWLAAQGCPPGVYTMKQRGYWYREINRAPLSRRAWVLQERILARRILHFTRFELMWECPETECSESYPSGFPRPKRDTNDPDLPGFKNLDPSSQRNRDTYREMSPESTTYRLWERVQEAYSISHLTNENDRLIALSGIAKTFRTVMQDEYVVGMWRQQLEMQLLWCLSGDRARRPVKKRARQIPSFSWLSVSDRVLPGRVDTSGHHQLRETLIRVMAINIEYATEDTTGLVSSASLHLNGCVKQLQLEDGPAPRGLSVSLSGMLFSPWIPLDSTKEDVLVMSNEKKLFYVPFIRSSYQDSITKKAMTKLECLLLELVNTAQGTFRRAGLMQITDSGEPEHVNLLLAPQDHEATIPCMSYDVEAHRHLICLV